MVQLSTLNSFSYPTALFLWNARSIANKLDHAQSLFLSKSIDVLCITETWLHDQILNNEIVPQEYTVYMYTRDRESTRMQRGSCSYCCV